VSDRDEEKDSTDQEGIHIVPQLYSPPAGRSARAFAGLYSLCVARSEARKPFSSRSHLGENATVRPFCCASKQLHKGFLGSFGSLTVVRADVLHG
jgi:hypothetical protein